MRSRSQSNPDLIYFLKDRRTNLNPDPQLFFSSCEFKTKKSCIGFTKGIFGAPVNFTLRTRARG